MEEHNDRLKQSLVSPEGSLPLISFLDPHIVASPSNVQLSEVLGPVQLVHKFLDEWQGYLFFTVKSFSLH